jgi:hypothetical protein
VRFLLEAAQQQQLLEQSQAQVKKDVNISTPATEEEAKKFMTPEDDKTRGIGLVSPLLDVLGSVVPKDSTLGRQAQARSNLRDYWKGRVLEGVGIKYNKYSEKFKFDPANEQEARVYEEKLGVLKSIGIWFENMPINPSTVSKWFGGGKIVGQIGEQSISSAGGVSNFALKKVSDSYALGQDAMDNIQNDITLGLPPSEQDLEQLQLSLDNVQYARGKFKQVIMFNSEIGNNPSDAARTLKTFNDAEEKLLARKLELGLL